MSSSYRTLAEMVFRFMPVWALIELALLATGIVGVAMVGTSRREFMLA